MYSDLFNHSQPGASGNDSNTNEKQLVSFKAGKVDLTLQENGNYWAVPDTRRGELRITWKITESTLYWEWYDRREKSVDASDRHVLYVADGSISDLGTLERVTNAPNPTPQGRLYVWTRPQAGSPSQYQMYWLQDASNEKDDELVAKVNQYLADPSTAYPSSAGASASGTDSSLNNPASGDGAVGSGSNATDRQQVDALSSILENLGMPQSGDSSSGSSPSATSGAPANMNAAGGTLTLADLQGAMAGLQQAPPGPPLQELVTPSAISSLMQNEAVKYCLLEFLPEEQRSEEYLEENLRSPQVQQTLRSLTSALMPDDTGSQDGYHSVLANFNMARGAQEALESNSNNPIQAFLECVLKNAADDVDTDVYDSNNA